MCVCTANGHEDRKKSIGDSHVRLPGRALALATQLTYVLRKAHPAYAKINLCTTAHGPVCEVSKHSTSTLNQPELYFCGCTYALKAFRAKLHG